MLYLFNYKNIMNSHSYEIQSMCSILENLFELTITINLIFATESLNFSTYKLLLCEEHLEIFYSVDMTEYACATDRHDAIYYGMCI